MLTESDTESTPSPEKNQQPSRISSCKTYEEIRLEEIQAESAAFYSYDSEYENTGGGGKMKRASSGQLQRVANISSPYPKSEDQMDFKVLTLDEIRSRKQQAKKHETMEEEESEQNVVDKTSIKVAIKALDELKDANREKSITRKRTFIEVDDDELKESVKRPKIQSINARPIKLKRRRIVMTEVSEKLSEKPIRETTESEDLDDEKPQVKSDKLRLELDLATSLNKKAVEVRICDSSTDDEKFLISPVGEHVSITGKMSPVSDDILKDIDALLTDDHDSS